MNICNTTMSVSMEAKVIKFNFNISEISNVDSFSGEVERCLIFSLNETVSDLMM